MVFWIGLIITIIFFIICYFTFWNYDFDAIGTILATIGCVWVIFHVFVFLPITIYEHSNAYKDSCMIQYQQLESNKNNPYLINDIIDWNENVLWHQKYQRNFWIGFYISNVYDDFKIIDVGVPTSLIAEDYT